MSRSGRNMDRAEANSEPHNEVKNRIFIRTPPFSRSDPELWFTQLESQFIVNRVLLDEMRFHTTIGVMDTDSLICIKDLVINPPTINKFETLRQRILDVLSESQETKFKKLFSQLRLDDKKPSVFLLEMKILGGALLPEEILKFLWIQRLSRDMHVALSSCSLPLKEVADLADKISEVELQQSCQINQEACSCKLKGNSTKLPSENYQHLVRRLKNLERLSRSQSPLRKDKYRLNSPKRNIPKNSLCWYHLNFHEKARKCTSVQSFFVKLKEKFKGEAPCYRNNHDSSWTINRLSHQRGSPFSWIKYDSSIY
ncbi:uncharacterized protein [Euwallacea fornicatus]|uniref:uncharacterized protein n=1 Tax=Euwallacea fornicatus TaxID=995702 RepID=UPI00338F32D6